MSTSETDKYSELRAKTDRQLIVVIDKALRRGLEAARTLSSATRVNGTAARLRDIAGTCYAEAATLLPLVYEIEEPERAALEARLGELRAWLEGTDKPLVRSAAG